MRLRIFTGLPVLFALVALSLSLGACGSMKENNKYQSLDASVRSYGQHVRWRRFADANSLHKPREGEPKSIDWQDMKSVRVTQYDIVNIVLDKEKDEAKVSVVYAYYKEPSPVVKDATLTQLWWYDEKDEHWYNDNPLPDFH